MQYERDVERTFGVGVKVQISTLVVYIFVTLCNFTLKLQNIVI